MAHIAEFAVEGLAGRTATYSQRLDRHLNVFFGLNGSGKTSLLKILNSAMSKDATSLETVPFKRAVVTVHSLNADKDYTYTYDKDKEPEPEEKEGDSKQSQLFEDPDTVTYRRTLRHLRARNVRTWTVEPKEVSEAGTKRWAHSYLPIQRLYTFMSEPTTEEELEESFAKLVNQIWSSYSADVLGQVRKAQEKCIADILKALLTGQSSFSREVQELDAPAVYSRVSRFMERQGSKAILGDAQTFQHNYQSNPQLRSVVTDINSVELEIQSAMAPRDKLRSLVESMFTGNKRVVFNDATIEIIGNDDKQIGLARLSSGEKQLIRILVEALRAERNSLILDEPEISMHIDWQQNLIRAIRQLNPQLQLIVATHSPEIMAEIDDKNIFRL
jgi:predicted ATP-dependent endonuclease of OLD family